VQGSKDEFANDFRNWHPDIHAMIHAGETPYKWALFSRPPMPA
jgi:salicylate hydroxylase